MSSDLCHCPPGTTPGSADVYARQKLLKPPAFLGSTRDVICIDECIAPIIEQLWADGIVTRACCCGHGTQPPSIIVELAGREWELEPWPEVER